MKLYTLKRQQLIRKPLDEVFSFFSKPENLELLTPKRMGFHILTPSPVTMKEGAIIDYFITIAGLRVRWTTMITCYEPPYRFVDLQLKGPYSYWHHTHTFTETNEGTFIDDEVHYLLPFGIFGLLAHALFVKRQLDAIFAQRGDVIKSIFPEQMNSGFQRNNVLTKPE